MDSSNPSQFVVEYSDIFFENIYKNMGDELLKQFIKTKTEAKKTLCKKLSFDDSTPLIGLLLDKEVEDSHRDSVEKLLEGACSLDVEIVLLADTDLDSFSYPNVHYIPYSETARKNLMQASDIIIALPSNDLEEMLMNGVVPISHRSDLISDYNPNTEAGNGFVYGDSGSVDHWKIFAALIRALESFKFPYDWKNIICSGLDSVGCGQN